MEREEVIACFQDTLKISQEKIKDRTRTSIKSNKVYKEKFLSKNLRKDRHAILSVYAGTSFDVAKKYREYGKIAVLNFANPHNPGGGVQNGAMAQEECLCRSSNLYACISNENVFNEYYGYHREMKNLFFSDRLIYTKNVMVFKNDDEIPSLMPENEWFNVDVITCSAPFLGKRIYTNKKALKELFKGRIKNIFEASIDNEVDVLILGAFGCGAFKNPPDVVAEAFYEVIIENKYQKCFKQIVFAIKSTNKDNPFEPCPNIFAFDNVFMWNSTDAGLDVRIMNAEVGKLRWADSYPLAQVVGKVELPSGRILKGGQEFNSYLEWKEKNKYCGKQFSILGDSISTLNGYNPQGYKVFYYGENCKRANIEEYTDTWWGEVLKFFGADLLVNNSWSGSRVTKLPTQDELFPSGCSDERTSSLHINSVKPDVIIINLGTNDWAFGARTGKETCILCDVEEELFGEAYRTMLKKIKSNYQESEIWCCTLSETFISSKQEFSFPNKYAGLHIEDYNEIIRRIVRENDCNLIDLYNMKMPYDSIDGSHPNRKGMQTIAASVCYAMSDEIGKKFLALDKKENNAFNIQNNDEYVFIDPNITTILYNEVICLTDISTGKEVRIKEPQFDVGRNSDCVIKLESSYIARKQATFFYEKNNWFIRDNASTNGTRINGVQIAPNKKYQLLADDVIEFANTYKYVFYKTKAKQENSLNLREQLEVVVEECLIGKLIGDKYQLQEIIGHGGTSKVYFSTNSLGEKFVVKSVLKSAIAHNVLDVLSDGIKLLKKLEHRYIRKVIEQIEDETYIFIIFEYVEGINLEELASKTGGILPVEKVIHYVMEIAEALQYIHSLNPPIINRDIKPGNILIDVNDNIKLVDFGIAIEYNPDIEDISALGTSGYAPPEQYIGRTTPKSDIFALGMVMRQLLTGVNPIESLYVKNSIRTYNPTYSKGLERIVEKCTQPNPDDRYSSCLELIDALNKERSKSNKKGLFEKLGIKK